MLRVFCLAALLIVASSVSAWTWAMPASVPAQQTSSAAHHCHETSAPAAPIKHHAGSCPCCDHGCSCLYSGAAPLPQFLAIRHPAPEATVPAFLSGVLPTPLLAQPLRPPIV